MPVNVDEIKKLSDREKLQLIDEIWESIEEGWKKNEIEESPETIQLLEERAEAYISGKEKSLSWEEVEELAKKKMAEEKNEKK
jgi:putative addiction module component (TIGR02574 family)